MKKKTIKEVKKPKYKPMLIKVLDSEREVIKAKAHKYADGNVSAWIRHASLNYVPKKKDLV